MGQKTKLKSYIKDDRPQKLKLYVTSHRLCLQDVLIARRRNLLHYCAQHGTADMLRCLLKLNCDPSQQDKHGNLPLHVALQRGMKHSAQQARDTLLDLILPLLEAYPLGQDVENKDGVTGHDLLTSLRQKIKSSSAAACSTSRAQPHHVPKAHVTMKTDYDEDDFWRQKISEEAMFEHEESLPRYSYHEDIQQETYQESNDDWFEDIRKEYTLKQTRKQQHTFWRDKKPVDRNTAREASCEHSHKEFAEGEEQHNSREERKKELKPQPSVKSQPSVDHLMFKKKRYESKFTHLLGHLQGRTLTYACIPWPSPDLGRVVDVLFCDLPDNKSTLFHKYLRNQQIRWHPDKFMQKFGDYLHPDHKAKILNRVMAISQILNGLRTKVNQ